MLIRKLTKNYQLALAGILVAIGLLCGLMIPVLHRDAGGLSYAAYGFVSGLL